MTLHPIVLCGGSGTRLWPSSRKSYPKQFARLLGEENSLFQETLRRLSGEGYSAPIVMTGEDFRFIASEQADALGLSDARILVEPAPRDTAPATLAAALMLEASPDDTILIAPSDHMITNVAAFRSAVQSGLDAAQSGALVTFGVTPDRPETGYGYLQLAGQPNGLANVVKFTEKPDLETARQMVETGNYLWNAGLFMGRVRDFIAAFERHAPDLIEPVRASVEDASSDLGFERLEKSAFETVRRVSLDYAIMEQAESVVAVPLDCGWTDLGAWDALWAASEQDDSGNATSGDVTLVDCEGSYLRAEDTGMAVVGLGLKDTVAVVTRDAVLVADIARAQDVKLVVEQLRRADRVQADYYPRFHRPWGWYETLCIDTRFQVKRIMVKPGGVLSLQSHRHRSEHWIVVAGTAEVTIGDEVTLATENQGVYIPLGEKHRLANPGMVPMYLIEVQTGAYLGEDDIIRYEDVYHRD